MQKLNIPYRFQWDSDATNHSADCGPTCIAMILNYHAVSITPDTVYARIYGQKGRRVLPVLAIL